MQDHLALLFKRQYGISLQEYRNQLRVQKAREMPEETDASVAMIVHECGFGSLSSFYSHFKRHAQIAPAAYRTACARKKAQK